MSLKDSGGDFILSAFHFIPHPEAGLIALIHYIMLHIQRTLYDSFVDFLRAWPRTVKLAPYDISEWRLNTDLSNKAVHWHNEGIPPVTSKGKGTVIQKAVPWYHDDVIKWKHFPRYWPFVRGIHRSPVNSPRKGQRRGAFIFNFDLCLNKRLSKHLRCWWLETPSCSLWRHCNATSSWRHTLGHITTSLWISHNDIWIFSLHCFFQCRKCTEKSNAAKIF